MGALMPIVAVSMGAKIIEKHFILDRSIGGPDASFSMTESEFKDMVEAIRNAEKGIGHVNYELTEKQKSGKNFSRSLYFVEDLKQGDVITNKNIRSIRPGWGIHPKHFNDILGEQVNRDVERGDRVDWKLIKTKNG